MSPLEHLILVTLAVWFLFYVVNHAEITARIRAGVFETLPDWAVKVITCPLCVVFWTLTALSLFTGFTALNLILPPAVLFVDLIYRRLKKGLE